MKNNHNNFNKIINSSGNEPHLGWWKFRKNRYITINHPSTTAKVLIYSDQGLRWIKNTNELNHQKEMESL